MFSRNRAYPKVPSDENEYGKKENIPFRDIETNKYLKLIFLFATLFLSYKVSVKII